MKQKERYRRRTKGGGLIEQFTPAEAATLAGRSPFYAGSGEHKTRPLHPSYARIESAALRSDATPCPPELVQPDAQALLMRAVERGTVSEATEDGFPRYVWSSDGERFYRGRLINRTQGWYKAHPIEPFELPSGFEARFHGEPR